jgi:hypothetical protein
MANSVLKPLLLAGALAVVASPSHAVLQIAADINGTVFTCFDNQAGCDTNPTVGTLQIADQTLLGVEILGSAQTQTIASGPGTSNSLNTSSLQIRNTTASDISITVAVGGTDFAGPVETFSASGGGPECDRVDHNVGVLWRYGQSAGRGYAQRHAGPFARVGGALYCHVAYPIV